MAEIVRIEAGVSGEELRARGIQACRQKGQNGQQTPQAVKRESALPEVAQEEPRQDEAAPEATETPPREVTPEKPRLIPGVLWATRLVKRMNITQTWDDTASAAVLLLGAINVGTDHQALASWSRYNPGLIAMIEKNLRVNGIWTPEGHLAYFSEDSEDNNDVALVEFCLLAMAGAGLVRRTSDGTHAQSQV